ncbi:MAG TPA: RES family NAD+ phosphorylase [Gemmatimonadaceae bacterium]|nr:RES family NAD+ phosphorylase [Gemmatimonadaceae bacterium]
MTQLGLWRVFPWDTRARSGGEFSPDFRPVGQGAGRFDIPDLTAVWYFGESPEHAVGEVIQGLRNQTLERNDLIRDGHPLALVHVTVELSARRLKSFPDLCDPGVLAERDIRPDTLASFDFSRTQAIARQLFSEDCIGFRWWSALGGDWHTTVLFDANCNDVLKFGLPARLTLESESVVKAAATLAIEVGSASPPTRAPARGLRSTKSSGHKQT